MEYTKNIEEIKRKTGMTEVEIQNLVDAYHTLDDIVKDMRPLNKDYPSEEYERVSKACSSLKTYLETDLKMEGYSLMLGRLNNGGRNIFDAADRIKRADACTNSLHELMNLYYELMLKYGIDYRDERNHVAKDYWEIVHEYELSRFRLQEGQLEECESFIKYRTEHLAWLQEDEARAKFYGGGLR